MGIPYRVQLRLDRSLYNQMNIARRLFNVILATVHNREELEQSWLEISQDLDLTEAHDQHRQCRYNRNE